MVMASAIWLGEKTSVGTQVIERLYANAHHLDGKGQYADYGKVGGCLITGNEDGAKHCATNILYSLQHLGYVIPPAGRRRLARRSGPRPELSRRSGGGRALGLDTESESDDPHGRLRRGD